MKFRYRLHFARVAIGGVLLSGSTGVLAFDRLSFLTIPALVLFLAGVGVVTAGCFTFVRGPLLLEIWDSRRVNQALRRADPRATIRFLETWIPEREELCPLLEDLLTKHAKQFRLEFLLMNPGFQGDNTNDLLQARLLLRKENIEDGRQGILATTRRLLQMKLHVDRIWAIQHLGAQLDMSIRYYDFMPFGPMVQIGREMMFVGFYPNFEASEYAPMLAIKDDTSRMWNVFDSHFVGGWNNAREVYDRGDGMLEYKTPSPPSSGGNVGRTSAH